MKNNHVKNIKSERYEKKYSVDNQVCKVIIEDAFYGEWEEKRELLDKELIDDMGKAIIKVVSGYISKYNPLPREVCISHTERETSNQETEVTIVDGYEARYRLEDVALSKKTREQIEITISAISNRERLCNEWGMSLNGMANRAIILNFYGQAGTGKSMTAEAIAGKLGKNVYQVNYSELESKYVGETPKNIKKVFAKAREEDAVLIFDEADSFLSKRLTNITQSADYGVNITRSVMLMELERFDGIVVFTTNLFQNYDNAFKRRILASVEFTLPDAEAREQIWRLHLGIKLPLAKDITTKVLADKYDDVSGADIKDIIYYGAVYAMSEGKEQLDMDVFEKSYSLIMNRYKS
jgi:SpoVK/Ycf46/Vps4 family AAA+-type ATPase